MTEQNHYADDLKAAVEGLQDEQGHTPEAPSTSSRPRRPAKWETMTRIEGRITQRQADRLDQLRKQITQRRTAPGERITNNTLLRVAVEVMLRHRNEVRGNTEKELLDSWSEFVARAETAPRPTPDSLPSSESPTEN